MRYARFLQKKNNPELLAHISIDFERKENTKTSMRLG